VVGESGSEDAEVLRRHPKNGKKGSDSLPLYFVLELGSYLLEPPCIPSLA
jgi:hypothetical protein